MAHAMTKQEVSDNIVVWMLGYLNYRFCKVKGSKQFFKLIRGTGQGGILPPMLWNFVMDSFLEICIAHATEAIAYADDGAIIIIAKTIEIVQQQMQTALDKA
jgi:hypothetical protein